MHQKSVQFQTIDYSTFISKRVGEIKLGEKTQPYISNNIEHDATYVIMGIQEDLGIRKNGGLGNRLGVYEQFLKSFLNVQDNKYLSGEQFLIDGYFSLESENETSLEELDDAISERVLQMLNSGLTPIIIGGGHNNSYGLLKALSEYKNSPIHVINLDAHADLRSTEFRHSGNGFSKAKEDNYLDKYSILGLHESYNNFYILDKISSSADYKVVTFEDIFLRQQTSFESALHDCLKHVSDAAFGVEWDVDSLEQMLSSAMTPVGLHNHHVMRYLYESGRHDGLYLHISEAVYERNDGLKNQMLGKQLSYAVQAFVKGKMDR